MELFIAAKQKRGFVLLTDSMACAIESGGTSMCRREALTWSELPWLYSYPLNPIQRPVAATVNQTMMEATAVSLSSQGLTSPGLRSTSGCRTR